MNLEFWHRIYVKKSRRGAVIDVIDYCPACWNQYGGQVLAGGAADVVEGKPHPQAECSGCGKGVAA